VSVRLPDETTLYRIMLFLLFLSVALGLIFDTPWREILH